MATKQKINAAAASGLQLPSEADFAEFEPQVIDSLPVGRVDGLDYSKWATAIIDLDDAQARIASHRSRIAAKGYRKVEGTVIVGGINNAEVWVIPRHMFEANRERRRERIERQVETGEKMEFATRRFEVTRSRS